MNALDWVQENCKFAAKRFQWPYGRIRAKDYMQYHRELLAGHQNVPLLRKMIDDVKLTLEAIIENSQIRDYPDKVKACDKCGNQPIPFYDSGAPSNPTNGDAQILLQPGMDMGYWKCDACGAIEGFEQYFENRKDDTGRWMYTDGSRKLEGIAAELETGDIEIMHGALEALVQFAHMSGPQANWFIEGGEASVDRVRGMA